MTPLVAYLLLFLVVGIGFIFVHLVAGKLIRPNKPNAEKGTVYECGEPTIGSAWVQFDLRFYVVALLFVIFDVEVAFFFPWAEVFGKANAIATLDAPADVKEWKAKHFVDHAQKMQDLAAPRNSSTPQQRRSIRYEEITGRQADGTAVLDTEGKPKLPLDDASLDRNGPPLTKKEIDTNQKDASEIAWFALIEILVFFGVLLVGFAYLWRRGDLEWVRSTAAERVESRAPPKPAVLASSLPARETVAS